MQKDLRYSDGIVKLNANGCKHEPFNTNLNWNNELNINHNSKLKALQNGLCLLLANRKNYEL